MNLRELIRCYLHRKIDSFYMLTQPQKRVLCIYALCSDDFDTFDLYMNHDGRKIHEFMKDFYIDKKITAEKAMEDCLDQIICHNTSNFQEIFDDEFEQYLKNTVDNCDFYHNPDNESCAHYAVGAE